MFMFSLLGHIAAAGMLYVAGVYGVWDNPPRDGMDAQKGDAIRVLWGFAEETPMSRGLTKEHRNVIPAEAGIQNAGKALDSHLRGNDGQTEGLLVETQMPLQSTKEQERPHPHHNPLPEGEENGTGGFLDETLMSPRLTKEHENVIPAQAGIQDAGRGLDSHLRGNDGQLEGFSGESGGNPDSSAPSMASMGTGGNCSRSAACMGTDTAGSEIYPGPGIDEAGSHGRGGQGAGLKTFLEALRAEIERHKNYPPFARKNGIEGTAYLNFHIGDNGRPDGIILEKSSGSKILDESAIRTLKDMERFYPVPEEIRELEITVPIAYRLVEDKSPPSP